MKKDNTYITKLDIDRPTILDLLYERGHHVNIFKRKRGRPSKKRMANLGHPARTVKQKLGQYNYLHIIFPDGEWSATPPKPNSPYFHYKEEPFIREE